MAEAIITVYMDEVIKFPDSHVFSAFNQYFSLMINDFSLMINDFSFKKNRGIFH